MAAAWIVAGSLLLPGSAWADEAADRAAGIVARMSPSERIGQLTLTPNSPTFDREAVAAGRVGGVLAFADGTDIAAVQALARRSPSGLPLLVGLDVLHGLRTMFPVPLGEAASFDPALARETARSAAREASALGINWTFAPMADLARDPRWGRMVEGFGEDPLLGRLFTAARTEGFREGGLATTLKHFAGYGAAIGGRDYDAAEIAAGDLSDAYLPPFRAGIAAGATSVMAGFHTLNGLPTTANPRLLGDILRGRLGFEGFVVSDWLAIPQLVDHGIAGSEAEAARKALMAGVDLDMASGLYGRHLPGEVAAGRVPQEAIDEAARRVVAAKIRMGLLDRPAGLPLLGEAAPPSAGARALARRAAQDSVVLLRNDGTLPLAPGRRVALVGGMAENGRDAIGPHAALVRWEDTVPILDGLRDRAAAAGSGFGFAPGCDALCVSPDGFDAAVETARVADVIVAVMGEPVEFTGEAASRAHLTLPGRQAELLDRLVATGKPVVLVLLASRPIELGPVVDRLAGLLMAWFPGTEAGRALADILYGDAAPSAKLPVSWPRTIGQVPLVYDRMPTGRPPDPANRFTLRYVDEELTPLFRFGFGLTYTRFAVSDVTIETPQVRVGGAVVVSAKVANAGTRPGREVVQLYLRQPVASESRPLRRLAAFVKVALEPGAATTVRLTIPASDLEFTRQDGTFVIEPGRFEVFVGNASDAPSGGTFALTGSSP